MAKPPRPCAQIIPFPASRSQRFCAPGSAVADNGRQLIQRALEVMLKPQRKTRRPS